MKITDAMLAQMGNYIITNEKGISTKWIYLGDKYNERYVIGVPKKENILVIGVNPGMSMPGQYQATTLKVTAIIDKEFDKEYGWIMVNLHPQRNSNPKYITPDDEMKQNNLRVIKYVVKQFNIQKIWCAWGNSIDKIGGGFLRESWKDIYNLINGLKGEYEFYHYGELTKRKNPRHPRFVSLNWKMLPYNPEDYIDK